MREYIEQSQSLIDASPQMDEQNTRTRLIDPFVRDVLGWDLYSTDIELEYSVQMGSSKKKVDYALLVDGTPAVFIEAKGCDTPIEGHDGQLGSYMQQEWTDWGLLCNGKRFKLFKLQKQPDRPTVQLLGDTTLENLESNEWMIEALSKEHIESGRSDTIYENVERRRRAIETLQQEKDGLSEALRELVVDRVGDVVSQPAESLSKEFIDDLVAALEDQSGQVNDARDDFGYSQADGQYQVTIRGGSEGGTTLAANSQSKLMGKTVNYLIERHNLIQQLPELPYVPGDKDAILNDEPKHSNGEEMRLYRELDGGYYVYTSLNQDSKKRYLQQFARYCDLDIEFVGAW